MNTGDVEPWPYLDHDGQHRVGLLARLGSNRPPRPAAIPDTVPEQGREIDTTTLPALLLISEPFGLNAGIEQLVSQLAGRGYVVGAPDLRHTAGILRCTRSLLHALRTGHGAGVDHLLAARAALHAHPGVAPDRIGVLGLCLGGGLAFVMAKTGLFRAAAPFYAPPPADLHGACPFIALYGRRDRTMVDAPDRVRAEALRARVPHEVHVYPDAGGPALGPRPGVRRPESLTAGDP